MLVASDRCGSRSPRRAARAYVPAAAYAALVLALGGWSGAPSPPTDLPVDKVVHLLLYAVLGGLVGWAWRRTGRPSAPLIPLLVALVVGAVDELHQRSVEARTAEWADLAADTVGVLAGFCAAGRRRRSADT